MKIRFPHTILFFCAYVLACAHAQSASQWRPDESAAIFTVNPNQVLENPYFKEVLNTYGLIGFAYSNFTGDHNVIALQKELGVKVEEVTEATMVIGNFMNNVLQSRGFANAAEISTIPPLDSSFVVIVRAGSEINPDTFFEKFDRWASGPAFEPHKIQRFREGGIAPEEIDQMSKKTRIKKELYTDMKNSEKVGETTLFPIPVGMLDQSLQNTQLNIKLGMQTHKGETTFALGSKKGVLAFFEHEHTELSQNAESGNFASFSMPIDGSMLKELENSKLTDPNGPLGPLATTLGEAMYQIRNISGTAKFSGGRAHFDLNLRCANAESAQAIWSVAQASLGMLQLNVLREQMRDPRTKPLLPLSFLNAIKLKHQGNEVLAHIEALPAELFPWAANKKFP